MWNIVQKRYWYFGLSALVLLPGIVALLLWGLNLAIDFTGGALLELRFEQAQQPPLPGEVTARLEQLGYTGAIVQTTEENTVLIRLREITNEEKNQIEAALEEVYGPATELRFESVGPVVGREVTQRAIIAVAAASVGILLYLALAFRNVPHPFRYGTCAIIALLHDTFVVLGIAAILGRFKGWQVDALFLTAVLTVIGFSVHDTIVVFDRIRENMQVYKGRPFEEIVNRSIVQTLDRSINTQLTALFTLTAIYLFGGVTIKQFVFWLIVGMVSGTYSSIFNAAPLLVAWENGELTRWLPGRREREKTAAA